MSENPFGSQFLRAYTIILFSKVNLSKIPLISTPNKQHIITAYII